MRRAVLLNSVARVLGPEVTVHDAAYMFTRHRWMVPYAAVAFVAVALLAPVAGIEEWTVRAAIGLAAAGVAVLATSEYRVVAQTGNGLVLMNASRIRQVATEVQRTLTGTEPLEPVGGTLIAADWQVGEVRYTVPRSSELAMQRMAAWHDSGDQPA